MKYVQFVVARTLIGREKEYLDTTEPDTWTTRKSLALHSEDKAWMQRLADRREATVEHA